MKIVYNPADGAPIKEFIAKGIMLDPHFPDGYEFRNKDGISEVSKGLMQYNDSVADELLETYQFLVELSPDEAQKIINRPPEAQFKCDFPGCEFETTAKIALSGHGRKHANQNPNEGTPAIDTSVIPVGGGKAVSARAINRASTINEEKETENGLDKDGVEWYGEGEQVHTPDFSQVKKPGQGHFVG